MSSGLESPLQRYRRRVLAGELVEDPSQLAAAGTLDELHRELTAEAPRPGLLDRWFGKPAATPRGLYMWGGVGTGKTLLMDLFCRSLPANRVHRVHFHRFMQWVHDEKNRIRHEQDPLALVAAGLAGRVNVLCLDEFAVTDITDAMILSALLENFFARNIVLVTTSNTPPDDLYRDGLQRRRFLPAIELLKTHTRVIEVDGGSDYRMDFLQHESLYHVPHDEQAIAALRESFRHLEGNMGDDSTTIDLCGRDVAVVAVGQGTVWFSFEALCCSRRAKTDYIELSRQFHTLILSDVPVMDRSTEDPARRFVELVDELYDRGVNLLLSAAAAPDELYRGIRLEDVFRRTASRLREMASQEYLARPHLP